MIRKIRISCFDYNVVGIPPNAAAKKCDGQCDGEKLVIYVCKTLTPQRYLETLYHEIMHAVHFVSGLTSDPKGHLKLDIDEEVYVSVTTPIWLCIWRDNPKLMDLLCEFAGR